jgi:5-methylcytosine-specific restriction endonuclease McrA
MTKLDGIQHGTLTAYRYKCRCDECRAANTAYQRAWVAKNAEKHRGYVNAWGAANADRIRDRKRARFRENLEARTAKNARTKDWRVRNPDKVREHDGAYRKANPDKRLSYNRRRRALRLKADTRTVTERDWQRLVARFDHRCAYCGESRPLTRDHVIPLTRGGRHAIGNLLPACKPCNSSKHQKLLVEWRSSA